MKWVTSGCTARAQHQHSLIGYEKCALCHNLPKHQCLITSRCKEFQANMSNYAISFNKVTASTYSTLVNICTEVGLSVFIMSCSSMERHLEHLSNSWILSRFIVTFKNICSHVKCGNPKLLSTSFLLYYMKTLTSLVNDMDEKCPSLPMDHLQSHLVFSKWLLHYLFIYWSLTIWKIYKKIKF